MANSYDSSSDRASILGPTLRFKGELAADEDLVIHGQVEGSVGPAPRITIGPEATVKATVTADVIVVEGKKAACRKLRDVKTGEKIVCGHDGIRVTPEFKERDRFGFAFMSNDVSSERRVEGSVARIAQMIRDVKAGGTRLAGASKRLAGLE